MLLKRKRRGIYLALAWLFSTAEYQNLQYNLHEVRITVLRCSQPVGLFGLELQ